MNTHARALELLHYEAERSPDDPAAWAKLGLSLAESTSDVGSRAAAGAALAHALALQPKQAALCSALGHGFRKLELNAQALAAFERALELEPTLTEAREAVAELLMEHEPESAVRVLEEAVESGQANWRLHFLAAKAHHLLKDLAQARTSAELATRSPGAELPAFWLLAQILGELQMSRPCIEAWRRVVELAPNDPAALTAFGSALVAAGNQREGISVLASVAQNNPNSAEAWINVCLAQKAAGLDVEAMQSAQRAVELAPQNARAQFLLGEQAEEVGQYPVARDAYEQATKAAPGWAEAHQRLGRIHAIQGSKDRARWALLRATELEPDNRQFRAELSRLMNPSRPPPGISTGAIEGQLSEFSVADAIELLRNMRMSGQLVISSGPAAGSVTLTDGMITNASSPKARSVVRQLVRNGVVTQAQVGSLTRQNRAASAEQLASQLLRDGLITQRQLQEARHKQVRSALGEMLDWSSGKFAFHKGAPKPLSGEVVLEPTSLILDIMRVKDEHLNRVG